ncbi:MAG: class I adenylate-forming enzyme family protein [Steroidobacteraceae bacterium]|nr:class I adenylate-forming enzyme family protein [Steroidobacteraceae bacterium]
MPDRPILVPATYQPLTITGAVLAAAVRTPEKLAVVQDQRSYTYRALAERMHRLGAAARHRLGLAHGDHAAVVGPNSLEYLEAVLGLADAGIACATLSHRLSATELGDICTDARAKVLFADPSCRAVVESAELPGVREVVWFGEDYERLLAAHAPEAPPREPGEWDVFAIPYTSGTTGRPKGVLLSHRSRALAFATMAAEYGCFGPDDRFLAIAPLAHGAGLAFALAPLFFGGTCDLMGRFDAEEVVRRLGSRRYTGVFLVPTQFHQMFTLDPALLALHRETGLKSMISNASALPQAMKERIVAQWGDGILHETYGSTECGLTTNLRPADQLRKQSCVGLPFPFSRVRLLDDDGREVPRGEIGELFTITPYLFNGYWQDGRRVIPETRDGWFSVGDLARQDDEGYVYIVDRKKDMIVTGGINVYPRQIEEVLYRHPAVGEVAVVGVPDEKWGERLKAVIALRPGTPAPAPEALIEHCARELSGYKVPREYAFVDALPRNANGKILKRALRD